MVVMRDRCKVGELTGSDMNQNTIMQTIAGGIAHSSGEEAAGTITHGAAHSIGDETAGVTAHNSGEVTECGTEGTNDHSRGEDGNE